MDNKDLNTHTNAFAIFRINNALPGNLWRRPVLTIKQIISITVLTAVL